MGDYSREAIVLNISVNGYDYSRDGYYSKKYGTSSFCLAQENKAAMSNFAKGEAPVNEKELP